MDDNAVDAKQGPDRTSEDAPIPTAIPADAPNVPPCPKCGDKDWWAVLNYGPGGERYFFDLELGSWQLDDRSFEMVDTVFLCDGCGTTYDDDDVWAELEKLPWA